MKIEALVEINVPNSNQSKMIKREKPQQQTPIRTNSYEKIFQEKTKKDFNEFYKKYYPKLVWKIKSMNITPLDAEDIANQAFMRALDKIDTYDPQWNFSTWLFHIGRNMGYLYKKNQNKHIFIDIESTNEDEWTPLQTHLQHKTIDTSAEDHEYEDRLSKKYKLSLREISHLPEKYKYIIELCDIQGKTYNEIVEITNLPLQTVKNRLFHGRLKLEDSLKEKFKYIQENI